MDNWETIDIEPERGYRAQRTTRAEVQEQHESIKQLVSQDAIIAIASGDLGEEYYLMKVSGNGLEVLDRNIKDDWSSSFRAGAEVFRGYFLSPPKIVYIQLTLKKKQ